MATPISLGSDVPNADSPRPFRTTADTTGHLRTGRQHESASIPSRASTILGAFEKAQAELIGKAVVLADGKAGTVDNVWLDELHGLRISIKGHDGKWPVLTVKFAES